MAAGLPAGKLNRARRSKPCARTDAAQTEAATTDTASTETDLRIGAPSLDALLLSVSLMNGSLLPGLLFSPHGKANMVAGGLLRSEFGKSETKPAGRSRPARPSGDA